MRVSFISDPGVNRRENNIFFSRKTGDKIIYRKRIYLSISCRNWKGNMGRVIWKLDFVKRVRSFCLTREIFGKLRDWSEDSAASSRRAGRAGPRGEDEGDCPAATLKTVSLAAFPRSARGGWSEGEEGKLPACAEAVRTRTHVSNVTLLKAN